MVTNSVKGPLSRFFSGPILVLILRKGRCRNSGSRFKVQGSKFSPPLAGEAVNLIGKETLVMVKVQPTAQNAEVAETFLIFFI